MKKLIIGLSFFYTASSTATNIFQASIPKSGTHLLLKLLKTVINKPNTLDINYARSRRYIICNHEKPTRKNILLLKKYGYRGIFIYRDPRDVVVSAAYFTNCMQRGRGEPEYSIDDLISHFICGSANHSYPPSETFFEDDVLKMFQDRLGWKNVPFVYTTTFEKLVGEKGGGSKETQLQEVKNILKHLNMPITNGLIEKICASLHSDSYTFRKGKIGEWKHEFTEEHKRLFKLKAGQLLIELGYEKDFNW
jgi:sulfotransferase 6B1